MSQFAAVRVSSSTPQSLPTGVWTPITFDSAYSDSDGVPWFTSGDSKIRCKSPGWVQIYGCLKLDSLTGWVGLGIRLNGSTFIEKEERLQLDYSQHTTLNVNSGYFLDYDDYLELMGYQAFGASLSTIVEASVSPVFVVSRTDETSASPPGSASGGGGVQQVSAPLHGTEGGRGAILAPTEAGGRTTNNNLGLVFDQTTGLWLSSKAYQETFAPATNVGTTSFADIGDGRTFPWSPYDAAGLHPQIRIYGLLYGTGAPDTAYLQVSYAGKDSLSDRYAAIVVGVPTPASVTGSTPTPVDSGWLNLPGTPVVREYITIIPQIKASSAGKANYTNLSVSVRWTTI